MLKTCLVATGVLTLLTGCSSSVLDDHDFAAYDRDGFAYEADYGIKAGECRADVEAALVLNFRDQRTDPTSTIRQYYGNKSAPMDAYRTILADEAAQDLRQDQGLEAFLDGVNTYILERCAEV